MNPDGLQRLFRIEGKIAVVTDSGGNSGLDVARVLAEAGAKVIVADQDAVRLQSIVAAIVAAGHSASAIETNVESEASVVALFNRVEAEVGSPDIVVNCAAMTNCGPLTDFTERAWDEVMSVDLKSVFFCMREAIRHMQAAGRADCQCQYDGVAPSSTAWQRCIWRCACRPEWPGALSRVGLHEGRDSD